MHNTVLAGFISLTLMAAGSFPLAVSASDTHPCSANARVRIKSLDELSIRALRQRQYASNPALIKQLGNAGSGGSEPGSPHQNTFIAAYLSDELRMYTRVDVPVTPMPVRGYPVMIFAHGWIGLEAAASYDFGYNTTSLYGDLINRFVEAGFVVLAPGFRGHGTVDGVVATGGEWMHAWDNGSYLMPTFYAVDVLNLLEGLAAFNAADWHNWGYRKATPPRLDLESVNLLAHSQGGDAALTVLAVAGEGSKLGQPIHAASIWSGNIPDRFTQANTFGPMGSTLAAFMSGDGSWTGSATGKDGSINPNFVFAWPSDWIGTLDTHSAGWTWQADQWSTPTVAKALEDKYSEMYHTLNTCVVDIQAVRPKISTDDNGKISYQHPREVAVAMKKVGGYAAIPWLTEPLSLHSSDQDYYSLPEWNRNLANAINQEGGNARHFVYPHNTHSLRASKHDWFSPPGTRDGLPTAVSRDIKLFSAKTPR